MSNATGGYQPPSTGFSTDDPLTSSDPMYTEGASGGSTATAAKDEASQVGQTAKEATTHVASTAAEEAKNVANESKRQAQELISTATSQVQEQAGAQKEKASGGLRALADELRSMAEGSGTQNEMITGLAQQAADAAQEVAGWLDQRDPGALVSEIRTLARRKPGTFLIGAAAAGVLAGRMTRGVVAAQSGDGGQSQSTWAAATGTTAGGPSARSTFDDGTDVYGSTSDPFASEAPSVTMPSSPVVVEHERATTGSEFGSGSGYGEAPR